ncbi:hypothetical protein [Alicyclobacillus acidiphilus]|uniref:hypothetical protein n=1 Tax=Alicyclobacillus acidiphilus TaxID=182455 RepID=UPI00082DF11D|nr:hypothetical protein [Alicyclobacillus acidiphilus]
MSRLWLGGALVVLLGAGAYGFTHFGHALSGSAPQPSAQAVATNGQSTTGTTVSDLTLVDTGESGF